MSLRTVYGLATPNRELLQEFNDYAEAVSWMCLGDRLFQRTITEVNYDRGGYSVYGEWSQIKVLGISHCAYCGTDKDLAPGWGFQGYRLYCVDHWCEITEHMQAEILWQQRHGKQAA